MRTVDRTIRDVKDVLNFDGHIDRELLLELSDEYARACDRAVERAYRCRQLQQKGLRHQAVQLARQAPDLRREFHVVDFAAAPAWYDFCEREGLTLPPILESEVIAGIIDEVYAESANLSRLLRVHRRMALGRAPLAERLKVLRRICRGDPKDSSWRAEILNYEAARVEELVEQARVADRAGDLAAVEDILSELRSEQWLSLPPEQFVNEVDLLALPHRRRMVGKDFDSLRERIDLAYRAMNPSECRRLLQELASLAARVGVKPDEAMTEQVAAVQRWLDESQSNRCRESRADESPPP
jgi:hypothetical protein